MSGQAADFRLAEEHHQGRVVLRLLGELDVSAAPQVRQWLVEAELKPPPLLVVDGSGLSFLDSSGISVLVHAHQHLAEQGGELRLAALPPRVLRVLELAGVLGLLQTYPGLDQALAEPAEGTL